MSKRLAEMVGAFIAAQEPLASGDFAAREFGDLVAALKAHNEHELKLIETMLGRSLESEIDAARSAIAAVSEGAFLAGYDAGWEASDEGHNEEYTGYDAARVKAYRGWAKSVSEAK